MQELGVALMGSGFSYSRSSPCWSEYLMFKPKGGQWVPLSVIKWSAWGCVTGTTVSSKVSQSALPAAATRLHPQWAHYVVEGNMTSTVTCPANSDCSDGTLARINSI